MKFIAISALLIASTQAITLRGVDKDSAPYLSAERNHIKRLGGAKEHKEHTGGWVTDVIEYTSKDGTKYKGTEGRQDNSGTEKVTKRTEVPLSGGGQIVETTLNKDHIMHD